MIAVIILGVVIAALLLERHLDRNRIDAERALWAQERQRLTNAVIARHPGEAVALNRSTQPKAEREDTMPRPRPIGM